jgi:hypothetical protein
MGPSILRPPIQLVAECEVVHQECGRVGLCRHGEGMLSSRSDEIFHWAFRFGMSFPELAKGPFGIDP